MPAAARYRPRHPHASPVWKVLHDHGGDFRRTQTVHDDHLDQTVQAFLRCGDFRSGFTRWRCPDCEHEFLLAFTCKQRGLCATCAQRRTLTLAPRIAETVCRPVPHRHLVLTVPRLLRPVFRRDRALLTELFHAVREVLGPWMRERTGITDGQPGVVAAAQTFGDFLSWHPHLHLLVTTGVFRTDDTFAIARPGGWRQLAELWRHAALRRLLERQAINQKLAEKILYEPRTGNVLYRSEKHWRSRRNFEVFSAGQFIEALVSHLPPKNVTMLRHYGAYSNKCRGMKRHRTLQLQPLRSTDAAEPRTAPPRPRWRQLILKVWGCDPLQCPLCQGRLRLLEIIEEEADIRSTLEPLGLWSPQDERRHDPPGHAPPDGMVDAANGVAVGASLVDARSARVHPWRPKSEPLAWRQYVFGEYTTDPDEDFDQYGCEVPPCYEEAPDETDQLKLFDDGYQPDSPDGEPVFRAAAAVQDFPEDDFIQYAPDESP